MVWHKTRNGSTGRPTIATGRSTSDNTEVSFIEQILVKDPSCRPKAKELLSVLAAILLGFYS